MVGADSSTDIGGVDGSGLAAAKGALFPNLKSVRIESQSYVSLALNPASPQHLFLAAFCRPSTVCIVYPSRLVVDRLVNPLVLNGKRVIQSFAELGTVDPGYDAAIEKKFSYNAQDTKEEDDRAESLRRPRFRAVGEILGNPLALEELLHLWRPEEVALHAFRFIHPGDGEHCDNPDNATDGHAIDPLSWATERLRIFAPTHTDEDHSPAFPDPDPSTALCSGMGTDSGYPCACNARDLWDDAVCFISGADRAHTSPHTADLVKPTVELANVGQNFNILCGCTRAYTAAMKTLKADILGAITRRDGGWFSNERAPAGEPVRVEIPHWGEVKPCSSCGQEGEPGHDSAVEDEGLLGWFAGDAIVRDDANCVSEL